MQYFVAPPQARRPRQRRSQSSITKLEDSLYIFPSPSSAPPSPSPSSEYSAPTHLSLSTLSEARSRNSSVQPCSRSTRPHSEVLHTPYIISPGGDLEIWDWAEDTGRKLDESVGDEKWECRESARVREPSPFRFELRRLQSTTSKGRIAYHGSPTTIRPSCPHPRVHIPLLSFFISLFSVDEATLHLLTHPANESESALFPGHALCSDEIHAQEDGCHGVAKLLMPLGEFRSVKEGCAVACNPSNPLLVSSSPVVGIWHFIGNVLVDGGKALKEFWS